MKSASKFEKVAARCWNLLNEGKPFTPIFVVGTMLLFHMGALTDWDSALAIFQSFLYVIPLLVLYYLFDFPLFLRNYLWIPFVVYLITWNVTNIGLLFFSIGLYFFFTVFFWGTLYYHLRIGTSWLNFTRFWKLVMKNSDSTSGNAQEQLPKFLLILSLWDFFFGKLGSGTSVDLLSIAIFYLFVLVFATILHRNLFDWKPKMYTGFTRDHFPQPEKSHF